MKTYVKDMTVGNPTGLLLSFMLPMVVGNIFQQLYNMVDSMIVGQIVGADICAMQDGGTVYSIAEEFGQGQHSVSSEGEEGYASKQENSASETVASSEVDEAESVEPTAETILPALDDGAWPVD